MNPLKAGSAVVCAGLLLYALVQHQFVQLAVKVSGTVESVKTGGGCAGGDLAVIRVRGARMDHGFGGKGRQLHLGDRVDVLVDPDDPTGMVLADDARMSWVVPLIVAMAVALATLRVE